MTAKSFEMVQDPLSRKHLPRAHDMASGWDAQLPQNEAEQPKWEQVYRDNPHTKLIELIWMPVSRLAERPQPAPVNANVFQRTPWQAPPPVLYAGEFTSSINTPRMSSFNFVSQIPIGTNQTKVYIQTQHLTPTGTFTPFQSKIRRLTDIDRLTRTVGYLSNPRYRIPPGSIRAHPEEWTTNSQALHQQLELTHCWEPLT